MARILVGMEKFSSTNVFGEALQPCGSDPVTGFFRDGCCNTSHADAGMHTVCAIVTEEFLAFSRSRGNDLTTPMPWLTSRGSSLAIAGAFVPAAGWRHTRPALLRA